MPGVNFPLLREQIAMRDVLGLLRFEPQVLRGDQGREVLRGDQGRGPCPVHGSRNPQNRSFSVNGRLGRYPCFVCGSRGNALELWSAVRGVKLHAAVVAWGPLLGMEVPWMKRW